MSKNHQKVEIININRSFYRMTRLFYRMTALSTLAVTYIYSFVASPLRVDCSTPVMDGAIDICELRKETLVSHSELHANHLSYIHQTNYTIKKTATRR